MTPSHSRLPRWFPLAVLAAAVFAGVVLILVPARLRLLGLSPALEGLLVGGLVGRLAMSLRMTVGTRAALAGCVAGSLAFATTSLGWWQQHRQQVPATAPADPALVMAASMLAQAPEADTRAKPEAGAGTGTQTGTETEADAATDAGSAQATREFRAGLEQAIQERAEAHRFQRTFAGWVSHHSAAIEPAIELATGRRTLAQTWLPAVGWSVWLLELALAGAVAGWFARRQVAQQPFCSDCGDWLKPVRSHTFPPVWTRQLNELLPAVGGNTDADTSRSEGSNRSADSDHSGGIEVSILRCCCESRPPRIHTTVWSTNGAATSQLFEVTPATLSTLLKLFDAAQGLEPGSPPNVESPA